MALMPGEVINNRYRIVKMLGQGGFGAVYRAWDTSFNIPCALKENIETSQPAQRQFEREARLLRTLKHRNLPLVIDYFILADKGQYLVMDFVEGEDLQEMLANSNAPLDEAQVIEWALQICDALDYLHKQDPPVIHRDIKPANIRITPKGEAMLVDFGIAKIFDAEMQTTLGARAVTPGYAPLEQYGQGTTDARTDIYALGATMYALLTAERPVESTQRAYEDSLTPPLQLNPNLSPSVSAAIGKAMQTDPNKRFQSAKELQKALSSGIASPGVELIQVAPTVVAPLSRTDTTAKETSKLILPVGIIAGAGVLLITVIGLLVIGSLVVGNLNRKSTLEATDIASRGKETQVENLQITSAAETDEVKTEGGNSTVDATTTALAIQISGEVPDDIPIMKGAENLGIQHAENSMIISYYLDTAYDEVITWYERKMADYGWSKTSDYTSSGYFMLSFQKDKDYAVVMVSMANEKTWVSIQIPD